jgi:sensor domain CHASE-containing protein
MKLYKTLAVVNGTTHIRWTGTQSDSKKARMELADQHELKKSDVEIEEVEIPTNKPGLLEFLNANLNTVPEAAEED